MDLPPGSRLGPYETIAAIGAGGMGQVFRARDTRLGRDVAVKLLAGHLQVTDALRERFTREARAIAKLSHPNICAIFDVGREGGHDYLVMELLDGVTLADRLQRGPLSLDQVLQIGIQIADALAAAHDAGIVHRDLKPANVMLTGTGVKLLDFGLAKAYSTTPETTVPEEGEQALTSTGVVLGTVPYMSPEQVEGKPLDPRTDVFALGSLIYEMCTGRPAFSGPNQAALLVSVLSSEPPSIPSLQPGIPSSLDRLVKACLVKERSARWQSARDVAHQLRHIAEGREEPSAPGPRPALRQPRLAWTVALISLAVAAYAFARPGSAPGMAAAPVRFSISPPAGGSFSYFYETNFLSVSPDGQQIAFVARDSTGTSRVWLRPLSAATATPLGGTDGAQSVFWAPDARSVAFFTANKLVRLDLPDGAPVTLTSISSSTGQSGTWGTRGDILFAGIQGEAIYRVPASGGAPVAVLQRDSVAEVQLQWPVYLPDGQRFIYQARSSTGVDHLMLFAPGKPPVTIMPVESLVQYTEPGLIAFVRDGTLLGQKFDWKNGRLSGDPFSVADGVRYFLSTGAAAFATSANGVLVFQTGRDLQRLAWFDRAGREVGRAGSPASYLTFSISPDGRRLLTDRERPETGTWDVWVTDLERGVESPVTNAEGTEAFGHWIPGGGSIVYSIAATSAPNMVRRDLASGAETQLLPPGPFQQPLDVSPDGRTVLYSIRSAAGSADLWTLELDGQQAPAPFVQSPFEEYDAAFSPDGRFAALISDETGRPELWITPFPGPGEKVRISSDGARGFRWTGGSRELVYLTIDGRVVSAIIQTDPVFRVQSQTTLFTIPADARWSGFDVTADGQRFLASIPVVVANRGPLTVISNWTSNRE